MMEYSLLKNIITPAKVNRCGDNEYPVLSMTMHDGIVFQSDRFKKNLSSDDKSNYKVVKFGQLVVGFPIDEGVLYVQRVAEKGIMSPAYNVWDIGDNVDSEYLELALHSPQAMQYYKERLRGTTARRRSIPTEDLLNLKIKLPNIHEQEKIVQIFASVSELISLRRQQIEKLDELVKARFVELMDSAELSEKVTVEQITERVKVGFVGTCEKYYTDASGIPMLRTGNITDHGIDMSDLKYVTEEFHDKNKKSQIHSGDLLIARHGSNGQANVYDGPEAQCLNAVVIVPNQAVAKSVFLAGLINSPEVKEQIDRTLVGSTQHVVNTKSIANLVVRIPCLEVQEQYEAFVEQTNKSKLTIQQSLDKLEVLKKSLMQKYFG